MLLSSYDENKCVFCGEQACALLELGPVCYTHTYRENWPASTASAKLPNQPVKIQVGVPPARE